MILLINYLKKIKLFPFLETSKFKPSKWSSRDINKWIFGLSGLSHIFVPYITSNKSEESLQNSNKQTGNLTLSISNYLPQFFTAVFSKLFSFLETSKFKSFKFSSRHINKLIFWFSCLSLIYAPYISSNKS